MTDTQQNKMTNKLTEQQEKRFDDEFLYSDGEYCIPIEKLKQFIADGLAQALALAEERERVRGVIEQTRNKIAEKVLEEELCDLLSDLDNAIFYREEAVGSEIAEHIEKVEDIKKSIIKKSIIISKQFLPRQTSN